VHGRVPLWRNMGYWSVSMGSSGGGRWEDVRCVCPSHLDPRTTVGVQL
jgi:hypothetical protein